MGNEEALTLLDSLETSAQMNWYRTHLPAAYKADSLQFALGRALFEKTGDSTFVEVAHASRKRLRIAHIEKVIQEAGSVDREALLDSLFIVQETFSRHGMKRQVIITDLVRGEFATVFRTADFPRALSCFLTALTMAREEGLKEWESQALTSIARVFERLARYEEARGYFLMALEKAKETGDLDALFRALLGVARVDLATGNPEEALARLAELTDRTGINLEESHRSLNFLFGDIRASLGDYAGARKHYEIAREWARVLRFQPAKLYAMLGIAKTFEEEGNKVEAVKCYEKILNDPDAACSSPSLWEASYRLGWLAEAGGDRDEALGDYINAIDCIESYREEIVLPALQFAFLEKRLLPYERLIGLLSRESEEGDGGDEIKEIALEYSDRSKAKGFCAENSAPDEEREGSVPQELTGRKREILKSLNQLRKEYLIKELSSAERGRVQREIEELKMDLMEVKLNIELSGRGSRVEAGYTDLTALDVVREKVLDHSTCIIEYFVGDETTYAWLLRRDRIEMKRLPHLSPRNHPALLYIGLLSQEGENTPLALGERLYRDLLSPFEPDLRGMKTLIIIPDGVLSYLPFEALPAGEGQEPGRPPRFLVEEFDISYAPSLSALLHLVLDMRVNAGRDESILAIGDPVGEEWNIFARIERFFRGSSEGRRESGSLVQGSARYPRLKHSGDEVRRVTALFPEEGRKILVGDAAEEEVVKRELLSHYQVVHAATHGIYDDYNPELSGLLLSASKEGDEDGFLVADEIRDLRLTASLVVLSGCETGLGRYVRGEGVVGLSKAFLEAGAASTLVSLWEIGDESTADFMEAFYRAYRNGLGKRTALSTVKRNMIREGIFPATWAPFILIGDPR